MCNNCCRPAQTESLNQRNVGVQNGWLPESRFQFSLYHLFLLTTAAGLLFGTGEVIGTFLPSLVLGLFIIAVVISLLGIENLILGGLVGMALAMVTILGAAMLCAWQEAANLGWSVITALLIYPMMGYTLGILCAANAAWRSD